MIRRLSPLLGLVAALALSSCSVTEDVAIKADGSGTASLRVVMSGLLKGYLLSLAEAGGQQDLARQGKVFDLKEIRKAFQGRDGVTVTRLASPSPEVLELDLSYRSLADLLSRAEDTGGAGALAMSESGGEKTLWLHLDTRTFRKLSSALPLLDDPVFQGMGPQENETITRDDYLAMMQFSMGAQGPALLRKSFVDLTIRPEGEITAQSGGAIAGGAVTFHIPLLAILVLDKPIDCSVSWR
jgi:hypothetical protein